MIFVFFQGVQIPVPMGGFGLCGFQFINLGFLIGIGIQQNPFFLTISRLEERSWKIGCVRDDSGLGRLIHRQGYLHTIFIAGKECFKVLRFFKDVQAILNNPHMVFGFCYGIGPRHGFNSPFRVQIGMNLNGGFCFGWGLQGLLRGDSPQKITDAIQKKFKVSRYQAARLVNTETSYFNALAAKETYKELGVKNVEILETLDSITCAFCASMDRKVVPMSEFQPGVTVPPFHPHCRGTTVPAIDEKYMGERAARDQDGKVYYVPGNMSYSEWKKTFVDNGSKDGLTLATIGSIIKNTVSMVKSEGSNVQTVGRIDIEKYRCITDRIATDEVIITPERIQHIEERHPGDYEQFVKYIADILENPDYILEANKPNTGVILKEIEENGEKFKVILRVKVESDPAEYRNSILSFWQIGETTWKKNVKNKKILYKRE